MQPQCHPACVIAAKASSSSGHHPAAHAHYLVLSAAVITVCVPLQVGELPGIHVRYDSSEALYLRKALNPRFEPHRAILRKSANPGGHRQPDNILPERFCQVALWNAGTETTNQQKLQSISYSAPP